MEPEVGCPLWYVRHDFYMMHLSSGLAAGYTNGVSQSSDSWFPCEIPMFEWLYPNHPIHNLHHIISYHIISTKSEVSQVSHNHPPPHETFIIIIWISYPMDSNGTSVEFPYIITIILYFPHFTGGFPWFSGWKPWLFPRSRVLSQEFDLPPALRQGLQLL